MVEGKLFSKRNRRAGLLAHVKDPYLTSYTKVNFTVIKSSNIKGLPRWHGGKESSCHAGDTGDVGSVPGS